MEKPPTTEDRKTGKLSLLRQKPHGHIKAGYQAAYDAASNWRGLLHAFDGGDYVVFVTARLLHEASILEYRHATPAADNWPRGWPLGRWGRHQGRPQACAGAVNKSSPSPHIRSPAKLKTRNAAPHLIPSAAGSCSAPGGEQVRAVLSGTPFPEGLVVEAFPSIEIDCEAIVHHLQDAIITLLRTKTHVARWLAVVLPNSARTDWEVLGSLSKISDSIRMLLFGQGANVEARGCASRRWESIKSAGRPLREKSSIDRIDDLDHTVK